MSTTFQGCYTALVTPFRNNQVDYAALADLVEFQIAGGVDGIVPVGTTGESPTLNFEEHEEVIRFVVEKINRRCQVIVGTGANSTAEAVHLTKECRHLGVDATLQVTPYYNKPTPEGLYRHFMTVAEEGGLPVILYNVPGRAGRDIPVPTVARLAKSPLIVAIKEAGGDVDRVSKILDACDLTVLSGDDALTLPMMALGATGVISVFSNICPREMTELTHAALGGDWETARAIHRKYYRVIGDIFIETNPIPIKTALAMMGRVAEEFRMPLCSMEPANRQKLEGSLRAMGILK
jgi:4-hydroxy-tetrahydrodipicolinate synthase